MSAPTAFGPWQRLDVAVFAVERVLAVVAAAVMTLMVVAAVVWRVFAGLGDTSVTAKAAMLVAACVLAILGVRTARSAWPWWRCGAVGVALVAGFVAVGLAFVWAVPNGLIFAQRLALILMMWLVMLGASMAAHARRHIFVQVVLKLVRPEDVAKHAALGLAAAAVFTGFLTVVSAEYAWANVVRWLETEGRGAIFDSIPVPYWAVTMSVPLALGLVTARFVGHAVGILRGVMPALPESEEELALAAVVSDEKVTP